MPSGRSCAVNASNAIAPSAIVLRRRALHAELAVDELEVVLGDSPSGARRSCGPWRAPCRQASVDRGAADRDRTRTVAVQAERRDRGVGVQHVDVLDRARRVVSATIIDQHGLVALAVRRGAGDHLHLAGRQHADRRRLPAARRVAQRREHAARRQAAHLDVATTARYRGASSRPRRGGRPAPCARRRSRRASSALSSAPSYSPESNVEPGRRVVRELVGRMKLRRRISAGSTPTFSRERHRSHRSIAYVASGRPAPRYASVGVRLVKTPVQVKEYAGTS